MKRLPFIFLCLLALFLGGIFPGTDTTRADTIYVANYWGSNIEAIGLNGAKLGNIARPRYPIQMTRDSWGNIYVRDSGSALIPKFSSSGALVKWLRFSKPSIYNSPGPMACDPYGNLYVVNLGTDVLEKFSPSGADLGTVSYTGISSSSGMTSDASGNLYVANITGIEKFYYGTDEGAIINGIFQVQAMACDSAGYLFVDIPGTNRIEVYSSSGSDLGAFAYPTFDASGLAFDSNGYLYATNPGNKTIEKFSQNGSDLGVLASNGMNLPMAISIGLSRAEVNANFARQAGNFMCFLANNVGAAFINISVSNTGHFVGTCFFDQIRYPINGSFNYNGDCNWSAYNGLLSFALHLNLSANEPDSGKYVLTGALDGNNLVAYHTAYKSGQNASEAGKYTATINLSSSITGGPTSGSTAKLTVGKHGSVIITGKLPDGKPFSASGSLIGGFSGSQFMFSQNISYPNVSTRGAKGYLAGLITFQNTPTNSFTGSLQWTKPQQSRGAYQSIISTTLNVSGSQ